MKLLLPEAFRPPSYVSDPCASKPLATSTSIKVSHGLKHLRERDVYPLQEGATWEVVGSDKYDVGLVHRLPSLHLPVRHQANDRLAALIIATWLQCAACLMNAFSRLNADWSDASRWRSFLRSGLRRLCHCHRPVMSFGMGHRDRFRLRQDIGFSFGQLQNFAPLEVSWIPVGIRLGTIPVPVPAGTLPNFPAIRCGFCPARPKSPSFHGWYKRNSYSCLQTAINDASASTVSSSGSHGSSCERRTISICTDHLIVVRLQRRPVVPIWTNCGMRTFFSTESNTRMKCGAKCCLKTSMLPGHPPSVVCNTPVLGEPSRTDWFKFGIPPMWSMSHFPAFVSHGLTPSAIVSLSLNRRRKFILRNVLVGHAFLYEVEASTSAAGAETEQITDRRNFPLQSRTQVSDGLGSLKYGSSHCCIGGARSPPCSITSTSSAISYQARTHPIRSFA